MLLLLAVLGASPGSAQTATPAHLECYRITDSLRLSGVVDLDSVPSGVQPGCRVSAAKLLCAPAAASVVSATDRVTGTPITPLSFSAPPAEGRICYKLKCPGPAAIAGEDATDEFGTRTVRRSIPSMLCSPVASDPPRGPCDLQTLAAGTATPALVTGVLPCSVDCLVQQLLARPHVVFPAREMTGNVTIGTTAYPQITQLAGSGETVVTGNLSGAGILIVDRDLRVQGSMYFRGLVIVRGATSVPSAAGSLTIFGALLGRDLDVAPGSGGASLRYDADALGLASTVADGASFSCP